VYGTQDAIIKGKADETVNILNGMIRTAGREMEMKTTKFKDGIIGMMNNVKDGEEKLKWHRNSTKRETMRRAEAVL
jgi:hypothetical protein